MDKKNTPHNSRFQNLEDSLYNPTDEQIRTKSGHLRPELISVSRDWNTINQQEDAQSAQDEKQALLNQEIIIKKKSSFFKKFFISSLLFFLVAIGFGVYSFFLKNQLNPEGNIAIGVIGSTFTQAGEELPLTVEIENKNDFALEVVDLIVEYPREGEVPTASLETTERSRISLGTIDPHKRILKEVPITLFGKEGDKKEIHFTLEYNIANASTIFQKEKNYAVTLSSSPITTRIIGPEHAVPNQRYRFTVEVSTNTTKPLDNILVALNYPVGFTYESATIEPVLGKNVWDFGTLIPGAPKQVEITGIFTGLDGDERSIRALFGTYLPSEKTKISTNLGTLLQTITLEKPFLSTELSINGTNGEFVNINKGEQIHGQIAWKNNLPNQVLDLEIRLQLKGEYLDREKIDATDGFYDSSTDSIVWNKNTIDNFVRIPVNDSGILNFNIPTVVPKTDGTVKNPQFAFDVYVKAIEDSEGKTPKIIESLEHATVRIGGDVFLAPQTRFHTGTLPNTGSYPPKINTETTYTVELPITNTINDYINGEFRAKLQPNVTFNKVFSPNTEQVTLDEKTGEIIWRVGSIPQASGVSRTVSLQLKAVPSLSQVGTFIPLLKNVTFTATDAFTKIPMTQTIDTITSEVDKMLESDAVGAVVTK